MNKKRSINAITSALFLLSANTLAVSQNDAKEQYIVTLNMPTVIKDSSVSRAQYHQTMADIISNNTGAEVVNVYYNAVKGFTVKATKTQISQIKNSGTVAQIYKDSTFTPQKTSFNDWGISRIDQRENSLNVTYQPYSDGDGVVAYIMDTGVDLYNSNFEGLFRNNGFSAADGSYNGNDCDGHGTSVASLVSSEKYGVAKQTQLVPVSIYQNVPECETDRPNADLSLLEEVHLSKVLDAIDYIQQDADSHSMPSVVNISFTWWTEGPRAGEYDINDIELMETALQSIIDSGITVVAGAGNDQHDACWNSPARMEDVITVGAINKDDHVAVFADNLDSSSTMSSYSNFGPCVDIFAPATGVSAASVRFSSTSFTGTSAASPFVTGAAALVLSENPQFNPAQVKAKLIADSTKDVIEGLDVLPLSSPNRLLYVGSEAEIPCESDCGGNGGGNGEVIALTAGQATPLNGASGSEAQYSIEVTSAIDALRIVSANGTGDLDIMVKFGANATRTDYECRSQNSGNGEECVFNNPQIGTYYINAYAYSAFSGAEITAHFDTDVVQPPAGNELVNGQELTGLSASTEALYYTIEVPASQTLNVSTTGGTGDADLYVSQGIDPTTNSYDCRAYNSGNTGSCSLTNNTGSSMTYHIMVNPYQSFSNMSLSVNF